MKQRNYELTVPYVQKYLPTKRHKNTRVRVLTGTVAFTVTELAEEEFPVALIVRGYERMSEDATEETIMNAKCDFRVFAESYRYYNGSLYKPVRATWGARKSTLIKTAENMVHMIESKRRLWECNLYTDIPFTVESVAVSDDMEVQKETIRELARNYVIYEDGIWEKTGEPMYNITTFGLGHNHGGTGFFIADHYNPNISARNYFRADRLDEAIAYFNKVAEGRGDTNSVGTNDDKKVRIDVLMPEVLKRDPAKDHANGGDPFMEKIESVIDGASSANEAGLLAICMTIAEVVAN